MPAPDDELFVDISQWWPTDGNGSDKSVRSVVLAFQQHSGTSIPERVVSAAKKGTHNSGRFVYLLRLAHLASFLARENISIEQLFRDRERPLGDL